MPFPVPEPFKQSLPPSEPINTRYKINFNHQLFTSSSDGQNRFDQQSAMGAGSFEVERMPKFFGLETIFMPSPGTPEFPCWSLVGGYFIELDSGEKVYFDRQGIALRGRFDTSPHRGCHGVVSSYVVQDFSIVSNVVVNSNLPPPCDIPITVDPQFRDTGHFCMSYPEYNTLMTRFPQMNQNINTTNNLLRESL